MKKVKIFLASSIEDLREDRLLVGDFFRQLNEIYLDSGIHFSLIKCEDYDNSLAVCGKQQEYDREIRESELVFFLFYRKVGDYTRHEFEVALEAFKDCRKPRIITYFKCVTCAEDVAQEVRDFMLLLDREMKHYYNTYGHIDTLKLGILMQIKLLQLDNAQVKLENGEVRLNGQAVVKAENVPLLNGNQTLRELTEKRRQLQQELSRCREAYLADATPEKEAAFFDTSARLNQVSRQLTEVEQETMLLLTTVAEMTSDGRVLTYRQKEALKYFNQGDYRAVHTILEDEERENELRRAQLRAEAAKKEIRGYVEEELLLIKTEKAQGLTEARVQRILSGYRKIAELVEKHDLEKTVFYEYAAFLQKQNQHMEAITVAEKLRWYYADPATAVEDHNKAMLYNLLGVLYKDTQRYREAEEAYAQALEIRRRLAASNSDNYEWYLATNYNNLGVLYCVSRQYEKAEEAYGQALEIRRRLAARNPDNYEPDLAASYNNLGNLYWNTRRDKEAGEAYGQALEIYEKLAPRNPDAYEPVLARSYNNLGNLYSMNRRYREAEEAYSYALEIQRRLAARNPDAFEPDLAASYNNLGNLYSNTQRYAQAEEAYCGAVEIYRRLADRNPDAYEPVLAKSYNNLGELYSVNQQYEKAEEAFGQALEIRWHLATRNPDVYEPDMAVTFECLGRLYERNRRHGEAEEAYECAIEIYRRLVSRRLTAYEPYLAVCYYSQGMLYSDARRYGEAGEAYGQALEIYEKLAPQNPDAYEPALADTLWNLAANCREQERIEGLLVVFNVAKPLYEKLAKQYPAQYQRRLEIIREILGEAAD